MFDQWSKEIMNDGTAGLGGPDIYNNAVAVNYDAGGQQAALGAAKIQQTNDDEAKRFAEQTAAANRAAALTQNKIAQDKVDPKNFKMEPSDDGGYNFFDGGGKAIDIGTFARATGARPNEILKDSQNPNDQKYVRDFEIVQTIANAMVNGDKDTIGTMRSQYLYQDQDGNTVDPIGSLLDQYRSKSPGDLMNDFKDHWGGMYGGKSSAPAGGGTPTRVMAEPSRQADQLSTKQKDSVANSSWDQVTAPAAIAAPKPGFWDNTWNLPGTKETADYNDKWRNWRAEEARRAMNPWLSSNIYGAK